MPIDSRTVKTAVSEHLGQIKSIPDLAKIVGVPPEALRKEFARRENTSLSSFISKIRVDRAKELLLTSDHECKQICFAIGFTRADTGSHAFKRKTGISMKKFRKGGM